MKKLILILVLVAMLMLFAAPLMAVPTVCQLAGYGPQWLAACLIAIALELWIDPLDLLHNIR